MNTKRTLSLIWLMGILLPLFIWLSTKTGQGIFNFLAVACSFVSLALMFYAAHREKSHGDKSETVSRRDTVTILSVVALWVVFVFYRTMTH
jgi:apolipoprotein N-acyltransferase